MPRIIEYNPSTPRLTPSDRSLQSWETAGRRVGPLYNQAAQEMEQAGRAQADMTRAKAWPFDVYALEASNAPRITQSTTNESRGRSEAGGASLTGGVRAEGGWLGDDPRGSATDYAIQLANAQNHPDDPEYNATAAWVQAHGEASAGAVGMSRLARAAARGSNVAATPRVNPNSDLPVDWQSNPDMNGQNVVDTVNGQFTPYQMQRFTDEANKRAQQNMDIWNRQQDQYWNGPNGWNTRRDKAIYGKGGIEDQWWQGYQDDLTAQDKIVNAYMKKKPDADRNEVIQDVYAARHVSRTQDQRDFGGFGADDTGGIFSPANIRGAVSDAASSFNAGPFGPSNIVGALKDTFGGMFGNQDEPAATADIP